MTVRGRVPFEANECARGDLILSVPELLFGGVSESKTSAVHCHARGARGPFAIQRAYK